MGVKGWGGGGQGLVDSRGRSGGGQGDRVWVVGVKEVGGW